MKVFIIDDDEVFRQFVRRTLQDCTLLEADSIASGSKFLDETKLDCVFLEYRLHGISGMK